MNGIIRSINSEIGFRIRVFGGESGESGESVLVISSRG